MSPAARVVAAVELLAGAVFGAAISSMGCSTFAARSFRFAGGSLVGRHGDRTRS